VVDPLKYAETRKLSDLKFSVFRVTKSGRVVKVATSIGIHRRKLLESTLKGVETMDLKYINTGSTKSAETDEIILEEEDYEKSPFKSAFKKFKGKLLR